MSFTEGSYGKRELGICLEVKLMPAAEKKGRREEAGLHHNTAEARMRLASVCFRSPLPAAPDSQIHLESNRSPSFSPLP